MAAMSTRHWSVVELLPHRPPMVLVDRLISFDATGARVAACLGPDHPFASPRGVPAHVGIELMAQACGVHVGALARSNGGAVQMGFLLGTRGYVASLDWFAPGVEVEIVVAQMFNEDGMGVYDCRILLADQEVAAAQLTLYQPKDVASALVRLKGEA